MKVLDALVGAVAVALTLALTTLALTAAAGADPLASDFWLLGDFTQKQPCKGDGSDPTELKVKISTQEIDSKAGICRFLDAKAEGDRLNTHVECQFPAGPLVGDITFTQKGDNTIDFVDRETNYATTLYRCPK